MSGLATTAPHSVFGRSRRSGRLSWGLRTRRSSLLDRITIALVLVLFVTALLGPTVAPDVYISHIQEVFRPPSAQHWFGTDDQGRDVFWRIVVGCRVTLGAAVVVVAGYAAIGTLVATVAAVGPRWLDEILMRLTDAVLAFPGILFAVAATAALGASLNSVVLALMLTGWPMTARLLRGIMRETMAMPFVDGARALGVSRTRLMVRHVLPNALPALWVKWAGDIGNTVIMVGSLSFIGAGAQPPSAEWGAMVAAARGYASSYWWIALFPGLAIALTTASFGLLGDMFHVRSDPATRRRAAVVIQKGRTR
ncbi:ABC transporter permease [Nocardia sp. CA2R105]|uniref:ABC transporter permease n=1 Tax=Nocardia coffeae TaxID=2873381 RepID=UPI001CA67206|nr:ABC transporter permease [Nocardia coffeae]MBY8855138.1 ABC transporter permease [Nocardia coffeae]